MKVKNLFANLPSVKNEEIFNTLLKQKGFKLERITSQGQSTPKGKWLKEKNTEWVILLRGMAKLRFAGDKKIYVMKPGDYLYISPEACHRVEYTHLKQKTVWLAVHFKK